MKFSLTGQGHNFFHWLVVVLIRGFLFFVFLPLNFYFMALGFFLSQKTLALYLSPLTVKRINSCVNLLPYFLKIKTSLFNLLNHWYQNASFWWATAIGIPLFLIGICFLLTNGFNFLALIFSLFYSQTHCPFCLKPVKIRSSKEGK